MFWRGISKNLSNSTGRIKKKEPSHIVVRPVDEALPSEKQYNRTKKYYSENKEKVLAQQKEYQDQKSLFEKAKIKMLYYLNSDPEYYKKLKPSTQQKYNFKKENGKWV